MRDEDIVVRAAEPSHAEAIRRIHERAFGGRAEADLVDALTEHGKSKVSLVAVVKSAPVGHILFSPVTVEISQSSALTLGLAPLAVAPEHQKQGIGSRLVRAGLEKCRILGFDGVVVLGHPAYYPRFGFQPAERFHLKCEYEVPQEHFMALELRPGAFKGCSGLVRYQPEFRGQSP